MSMNIKISEFFNFEKIMEKMKSTSPNFPIKLGFKVFNYLNKLHEVDNYICDRMKLIFDIEKLKGNKDFTEDEKKIFEIFTENEIEIPNPDFSLDDIINSSDLKLNLNEISILNKFLLKKE